MGCGDADHCRVSSSEKVERVAQTLLPGRMCLESLETAILHLPQAEPLRRSVLDSVRRTLDTAHPRTRGRKLKEPASVQRLRVPHFSFEAEGSTKKPPGPEYYERVCSIVLLALRRE